MSAMAWFQQLTRPEFAATHLTMRRPVLIVIDMVNDFLEKWSPAPKQQLLQSINDLVALMRQHGHPIIWVRQEEDAR